MDVIKKERAEKWIEYLLFKMLDFTNPHGKRWKEVKGSFIFYQKTLNDTLNLNVPCRITSFESFGRYYCQTEPEYITRLESLTDDKIQAITSMRTIFLFILEGHEERKELINIWIEKENLFIKRLASEQDEWSLESKKKLEEGLARFLSTYETSGTLTKGKKIAVLVKDFLIQLDKKLEKTVNDMFTAVFETKISSWNELEQTILEEEKQPSSILTYLSSQWQTKTNILEKEFFLNSIVKKIYNRVSSGGKSSITRIRKKRKYGFLMNTSSSEGLKFLNDLKNLIEKWENEISKEKGEEIKQIIKELRSNLYRQSFQVIQKGF